MSFLLLLVRNLLIKLNTADHQQPGSGGRTDEGFMSQRPEEILKSGTSCWKVCRPSGRNTAELEQQNQTCKPETAEVYGSDEVSLMKRTPLSPDLKTCPSSDLHTQTEKPT